MSFLVTSENKVFGPPTVSVSLAFSPGCGKQRRVTYTARDTPEAPDGRHWSNHPVHFEVKKLRPRELH